MQGLPFRGSRSTLAMIYLPDTNFFLHCKDPTDIDWSAVTTDAHVRIVICSNTQRELDKKKFELRGRGQQRARKWVGLIGDAMDADGTIEQRPFGSSDR